MEISTDEVLQVKALEAALVELLSVARHFGTWAHEEAHHRVRNDVSGAQVGAALEGVVARSEVHRVGRSPPRLLFHGFLDASHARAVSVGLNQTVACGPVADRDDALIAAFRRVDDGGQLVRLYRKFGCVHVDTRNSGANIPFRDGPGRVERYGCYAATRCEP